MTKDNKGVSRELLNNFNDDIEAMLISNIPVEVNYKNMSNFITEKARRLLLEHNKTHSVDVEKLVEECRIKSFENSSHVDVGGACGHYWNEEQMEKMLPKLVNHIISQAPPNHNREEVIGELDDLEKESAAMVIKYSHRTDRISECVIGIIDTYRKRLTKIKKLIEE